MLGVWVKLGVGVGVRLVDGGTEVRLGVGVRVGVTTADGLGHVIVSVKSPVA